MHCRTGLASRRLLSARSTGASWYPARPVAPILCRLDLHPLVLVDMPARFDLEDLAKFTRAIDALYVRGGRFSTLVDSRAVVSVPDAAVRKRLADWQNETRERIAKHNVFTATVTDSALVRGAMTAIHWIFRPPNEQVTVASYPEGFRRCMAALEAEGVALPQALVRVRAAAPRSSAHLLA